MASASNWFRDKLLNEKIQNLTVNDNFSDEAFKDFLELAHGSEITISARVAASVLQIAERWEAPAIVEAVKNILKGSLGIDSLIEKFSDDYRSHGHLPTSQSIQKPELEKLLRSQETHSMNDNILRTLVSLSREQGVSKARVNQFVIDHIQRGQSSPDWIEFFDFSQATEAQLVMLAENPQYKDDKRVKKAMSRRKGLSSPRSPDSEKKKGPFLKMKPPFYGVFASIGIECGGDPVLSDCVRITAPTHDPQMLIDPKREYSLFIIEGDKPSITFKLPEAVALTGYKLTNSFKWTAQEWIWYGSEDNENWEVIQEMTKPEELIEPFQEFTGKFEKKTKAYSRYRFIPTQTRENGKKAIIIRLFELIGEGEYENGVFAKFLSDNQFVHVTTSMNSLQTLANPRDRKMWFSANEPDQYVQFQLVKHALTPIAYTLRSGEFWHLKSWNLEGSWDGQKWFLVDRRRNAYQMDNPYKVTHWRCKCNQECRFFRLIQVGHSYDGMNILCLSGVEFFGIMREMEKIEKGLVRNTMVVKKLDIDGLEYGRDAKAASSRISPVKGSPGGKAGKSVSPVKESMDKPTKEPGQDADLKRKTMVVPLPEREEKPRPEKGESKVAKASEESKKKSKDKKEEAKGNEKKEKKDKKESSKEEKRKEKKEDKKKKDKKESSKEEKRKEKKEDGKKKGKKESPKEEKRKEKEKKEDEKKKDKKESPKEEKRKEKEKKEERKEKQEEKKEDDKKKQKNELVKEENKKEERASRSEKDKDGSSKKKEQQENEDGRSQTKTDADQKVDRALHDDQGGDAGSRTSVNGSKSVAKEAEPSPGKRMGKLLDMGKVTNLENDANGQRKEPQTEKWRHENQEREEKEKKEQERKEKEREEQERKEKEREEQERKEKEREEQERKEKEREEQERKEKEREEQERKEKENAPVTSEKDKSRSSDGHEKQEDKNAETFSDDFAEVFSDGESKSSSVEKQDDFMDVLTLGSSTQKEDAKKSSDEDIACVISDFSSSDPDVF